MRAGLADSRGASYPSAYASGSEVPLVLVERRVLAIEPAGVAKNRQRRERFRRCARRRVGEPLRGFRVEIPAPHEDRLAGDAGPRLERLFLDGVAEDDDFHSFADAGAAIPEELFPL